MSSHADNKGTHGHGYQFRPWYRIRQLILVDRSDIYLIVTFALLVAILSLATPIAVEAMVSTVMFGVLLWPIIWLAVALFGFMFLSGLIRVAEVYVIEILQRRIFVRVVERFSRLIPRVQMTEFNHEYGPALINRFFDVQKVQKSMATLLLDGIELVLIIIVGLTVLAFYHPLLLAFDVGLIVCLILLILLGRGGVKTSIEESHVKYEVAEWLQELARIPRTIRTAGGPVIAVNRADHLAHEYVIARKAHFSIVFRQFSFAVLIQIVANVLLLGLGGWLVTKQELTIGQLIASELIIAMVVNSLLKIYKYLDSWYDLFTGVEKLGVIDDLPTERDTGAPLPARPVGISIKVQDATFRIYNQTKFFPNFTIRSGEKIALVGSAGVGKSVLLDFFSGFKEPTSGVVSLDGVSLKELQLESVRQQVSVVHELEIINGTVYDNILLRREALTVEQISEALDRAGILNIVNHLEDGLQTRLMPNGRPLSETEAMRLCIARAIVAGPRLLVLDGVLDRLDLEECPRLLETLFAENAPWTLVVVTRNQEILDRCDRVLNLDYSEVDA
ncbi:MAG: ABC transporter ATP-binding protein [Zavarzinella sp.]